MSGRRKTHTFAGRYNYLVNVADDSRHTYLGTVDSRHSKTEGRVFEASTNDFNTTLVLLPFDELSIEEHEECAMEESDGWKNQ